MFGDRLRALMPRTVLLGMGADMHTASLFPGADRLEEALASDAPILLPMRAGDGGRAAHHHHGAASGGGDEYPHSDYWRRSAAIERAAHLPPLEAPISAVLKNATVHWAE